MQLHCTHRPCVPCQSWSVPAFQDVLVLVSEAACPQHSSVVLDLVLSVWVCLGRLAFPTSNSKARRPSLSLAILYHRLLFFQQLPCNAIHSWSTRCVVAQAARHDYLQSLDLVSDAGSAHSMFST